MLDLMTKNISWMDAQGKYALNGIDGLYLSGRMLIATQNGTSPERVVRFELDKSLTRIESESILERSTPTLGDPTHGVVLNSAFYYIANSGWDTLEDDGTLKPGAVPVKSRLMRANLGDKGSRNPVGMRTLRQAGRSASFASCSPGESGILEPSCLRAGPDPSRK